MEIKIDPEFKRLIPPLSIREREQLKENILRDGCRDPLVVWDRVLLDGHNRYEVCTEHDIDFDVYEVLFVNRGEAKKWIITNQLGRRNLSPEQLAMFRGMLYNAAKKTMAEAGAMRGASDKLPQASTAEQLAEQHGVDARTIKRDGKFAEAVEALEMEEEVASGAIAAPKAVIVEAAKPIVEAKKAHQKWEEEVRARPLAPPPEPPKPTIAEVQKAKAHVSYNTGENEWYTPGEYIKAATEAMGGIDLDPASSEIANRTVNAGKFFTKNDDGLKQKWFGRVWLNPPYAQPLISNFAEAIAAKYESREIDSAVVLVNNATETAWFQRMLSVADAICLPRGRIRFLDPNGVPGAPLQGQAILYFGNDADSFSDAFSEFGRVLNG